MWLLCAMRSVISRRACGGWSQSDAEVLVYMDVDLSTDLNALLPLVEPPRMAPAARAALNAS